MWFLPKVSKGLWISNTLLNDVVMQQMVIEMYFLMTEALTVTGPRVLCQHL